MLCRGIFPQKKIFFQTHFKKGCSLSVTAALSGLKQTGMSNSISPRVAVIVAHPDDETLWAGGTILSNASWQCFIACLCRANDPDRAPKFAKVLNKLGARGRMADLDDGPEQTPLKDEDVQQCILELLPGHEYDLVITHNPYGEYTRHRRHEEVGKAVINLWATKKLQTQQLWTFAYEDGMRTYYPQPLKHADSFETLPPNIWAIKYDIMTRIYGFDKSSWEAQATPKTEAFMQFETPAAALQLLHQKENLK